MPRCSARAHAHVRTTRGNFIPELPKWLRYSLGRKQPRVISSPRDLRHLVPVLRPAASCSRFSSANLLKFHCEGTRSETLFLLPLFSPLRPPLSFALSFHDANANQDAVFITYFPRFFPFLCVAGALRSQSIAGCSFCARISDSFPTT